MEFYVSLLLTPLSLGYLLYLNANQELIFSNLNLSTDVYLFLAGLVTVVPLVLFTSGARLLPMTTTGILFYITPTMQFLVGAVIFKEPLNTNQFIGFIGIWIGLVLYALSLINCFDHAVLLFPYGNSCILFIRLRLT